MNLSINISVTFKKFDPELMRRFEKAGFSLSVYHKYSLERKKIILPDDNVVPFNFAVDPDLEYVGIANNLVYTGEVKELINFCFMDGLKKPDGRGLKDFKIQSTP